MAHQLPSVGLNIDTPTLSVSWPASQLTAIYTFPKYLDCICDIYFLPLCYISAEKIKVRSIGPGYRRVWLSQLLRKWEILFQCSFYGNIQYGTDMTFRSEGKGCMVVSPTQL